MFLISTIAPILCGTILTAQPDSPSKLMVLRVFFYICGAVCLLCSFVLSRIPGGERSPEMLQQVPKFSFSSFGEVFRDLAHSKKFLSYFICIMFFLSGLAYRLEHVVHRPDAVCRPDRSASFPILTRDAPFCSC